MKHVIPISEKDSLTTAIVQAKVNEPDFNYRYIFNDTGAELPESYEWLRKVERKLGIQIERIGKSLTDIIYDQKMLPSGQARFCTRMSKIEPMEKLLNEPSYVYFGLRADESRAGYNSTNNIIHPVYPLIQNKIKLNDVYNILTHYDLLPPTFFWQKLYDKVTAKLGSHTAILDQLPKWLFDQLFSWRSRQNCFFCFYQRRYEWVGLLDNHPELFEEAEKIENAVAGGDRREHAYYWIGKDFPLSKIRGNFDHYLEKRADDVTKTILKMTQRNMFSNIQDDMDLAGTSCGMFCGK